MQAIIAVSKVHLIKKPGTKTVWIPDPADPETVEVIDMETVRRITGPDTLGLFRRLGGSETLTRAYTCMGYLPYRLVSTSPDKSRRTVRTFAYSYAKGAE